MVLPRDLTGTGDMALPGLQPQHWHRAGQAVAGSNTAPTGLTTFLPPSPLLPSTARAHTGSSARALLLENPERTPPFPLVESRLRINVITTVLVVTLITE